MLADLIAIKGVIAGAWFLLLFVSERFVQAAKPPPFFPRVYRNLGLWLIMTVFAIAVIAPVTVWGVNHAFWQRPGWLTTGMTGVFSTLLDFVILDFWLYWLHRAYHRVPIMWRMHQVHHRDEFLDTTTALRFHISETALSAVLRLAVITMLAIPLVTVIAFEMVLLIVTLFQHSNLRVPASIERILARIIVTPSIHWVHHHATGADTNSNFASCLSIWDKLFFTKSATERSPDMEIGIQGVKDVSLLGLMLDPFRKQIR